MGYSTFSPGRQKSHRAAALRVAGHPPLRTLQPVALSSRMWISSSCFAFGFVIVVSLVCRGASQQGVARQEREARQDGERRQDGMRRVRVI
jgi:hypothetical protein